MNLLILKIAITISAILYSVCMGLLIYYYIESISNKEYTKYFLSEGNGDTDIFNGTLFKITSTKAGRIILLQYSNEYNPDWTILHRTMYSSGYKQLIEYYRLKYLCHYKAENLIKHRLVMKELEA